MYFDAADRREHKKRKSEVTQVGIEVIESVLLTYLVRALRTWWYHQSQSEPGGIISPN